MTMLNIRGIALPYERAAYHDAIETNLTFAAGAFGEDVYRCREIPLRVNHGRKTIGSATVFERCNKSELWFSGEVDDEDWARLLARLAQYGQIHGASVGWDSSTVRAAWVDDERVIREAKLTEISVIIPDHRPMFEGTTVLVGRLIGR